MAQSRRSTTKTPSIRNVMDIRGPLRKGTLIHFSAEQWKRATAKLPRGTRPPKRGIYLEAYPVPGEDVIAQPACIQGPCEICRIRTRLGPRGEIMFDCQCRPDPRCPEDPPPPPPSPPTCRLVIQRTGGSPRTGGFVRLACVSQGCQSPRGCRLTAIRQGFRWIIACACG